MAVPTLRQRLAKGDVLITSWLSLPGRFHGSIFARAACDAVTIDMQHGHIGFADMVALTETCNLIGKPPIIRVPVGELSTLSRALDAGAGSVIMPMVNTPAEAAAVVAHAKYPPLGNRSWGPYLAMKNTGEAPDAFLNNANANTMVFVMVETRQALENIDAICAVPGLDGIFVGPADLSISLSGAQVMFPDSGEPLAAVKHIAATANAKGLVPAIYAGSPDVARRWAGVGYRLITLGFDAGMIADAADAAFKAARA